MLCRVWLRNPDRAEVMLLLVWVLPFVFDVHAPNKILCVFYTAILLLQLPWPEPSWFYALWFAVNWPTFGPKGRPKASTQDKEETLREEVAKYIMENPQKRLPASSALYKRLQRVKLLHLLDKPVAETPEEKEARLLAELQQHLADSDGVRPSWTSPLYVKLQKAGLLRMLETSAMETQEEKEARLLTELQQHLADNDGVRPSRTSPLYVKLQKAGLLRLLETSSVETPEEKEARLLTELQQHLADNDGVRPSWTSSLYVKLQKAGLLRLLETSSVELPEEKEARLLTELQQHLADNDGVRPSWTLPLYVKLQKAGLLRLLETSSVETPEEKEARLLAELQQHLADNDGVRPSWTSPLYVKLQKAGLLRLLETSSVETPEEQEARLLAELQQHLADNDGVRPSWTLPLYVKLQKAGLLHRLPSPNASAGLPGKSTTLLDPELSSGVLQFVAGKSVLDCLPFMVDMEEESLQRYSKDVAQSRRCFFADILVAVTRGLEPSSKFGMETLTAEAQDAACSWLDSLSFVGYDDTKTLRNTLLRFCQEEQRWPEKDGGHALDRALLTSLGKLRSRRFGPVTNKRQGNIHEYALPLREDQMLAWETLPYQSCFVWWPHHLEVFEQVRMLWDEQGILPTRGPQSATDALAQKVRRVRAKTLLPGRKAMRAAEQACWESTFPKIWQRRVDKEAYIQAADFQDFECRWPFARSPQALQMMACELCGVECNTHLEFIKHLEQTHVLADDEGSRASWWTKHRVVEEYRKRMVFYEQTEGSLLCVSHVMSLQVQLLGYVFFDHLYFRTPLCI